MARGMSVGASGAVFGFMGAAAAYVVRNKAALGRSGDAILSNVGQVLFLNLIFGAQRGSGIDQLGHIGGVVTGAVFGLLLAPDAGSAGRRSYASSGGRGGDDGALLPPALTRALLAATCVAYALGLREAARYTGVVRRMMG